MPRILQDPGWEVLALTLRTRPESEESLPHGFVASFHHGVQYVPRVIGLDYRFVRSHGLYRQSIRHMLRRAESLGCKRMLCGIVQSTRRAALERTRSSGRSTCSRRISSDAGRSNLPSPDHEIETATRAHRSPLFRLALLPVCVVYASTELRLRRVYTVPAVTLDVPTDAASIERGQHLVQVIAQCTTATARTWAVGPRGEPVARAPVRSEPDTRTRWDRVSQQRRAGLEHPITASAATAGLW